MLHVTTGGLSSDRPPHRPYNISGKIEPPLPSVARLIPLLYFWTWLAPKSYLPKLTNAGEKVNHPRQIMFKILQQFPIYSKMRAKIRIRHYVLHSRVICGASHNFLFRQEEKNSYQRFSNVVKDEIEFHECKSYIFIWSS